MTSLVLELQRDAMDPNIRGSDLLRKAIAVATKLRIDDFKAWAEKELSGYGREPTPPYRHVEGQLRAHNPYHGWIPVVIENSDLMDRLSQRDVGSSIGDLEALYYDRDKRGTLQMPLPHDWLMKVFGDTQEFNLGIVPTLLIGQNQIYGILDAVRNEILKWALKLERQEILGDGLSFSKEEVQRAATATYHIQHFSGVLGNVTSSTVQIGDYATIHQELKQRGVPQDARNELENILDALREAPPQEKQNVAKRGLNWVAKYGPAIGTLSETIRGWFQTLSP